MVSPIRPSAKAGRSHDVVQARDGGLTIQVMLSPTEQIELQTGQARGQRGDVQSNLEPPRQKGIIKRVACRGGVIKVQAVGFVPLVLNTCDEATSLANRGERWKRALNQLPSD